MTAGRQGPSMVMGSGKAADTGAQRVMRMHPGRALVAMARPSQIALIWTIYAGGLLLGWSRPGSVFDPWTAAVVALLITVAAASSHLVNEAEDAATDRLTERTPFSGGSGALEASGLQPAVPLWLGLTLAGLTAAATWAAWLIVPLPSTAVTLVLAGLVGALVYSLPPLAAMRHGWGEPLNAILGGLLLPLAGVAVVAGQVGIDDALVFAPFTLVVLASVMATAWPDREADAATGKATLAVRCGPVTLRRIHAGASIGFVVATLVAAVVGAGPFMLVGLVVVPALVIGAAGYTRRTSPLANVVAMVGLAIVLLATNALGLAMGWSA